MPSITVSPFQLMSTENDYQNSAPKCFIVIDDDSINNFISRLTILKFIKNADVKLFTDPELALENIANTICDTGNHLDTIILLDINMPIMDGWKFLDEFLNFGEDVRKKFKIYMFSSSIDRADLERANKHLLVTNFFSKPLNANNLVAIVGKSESALPSN